ncbi:MAG: hypothetical protein V1793_05515 [Pseudomonadota bacterium]
MRISSLISGLCLLVFLSAGCVSTTGPAGKGAPANEKLVQQYLDKGSSFENQGDLVNALEQYKLALTVDGSNNLAARKKQDLEQALQERAEAHYQAGLKLDREGQPDQARKEYLAALQNWPEHAGAKERVTYGKILDKDRFVIHTIEAGDSVSKLAKIYYGNYKKYPVISQFNQMKDATQTKIGQKIKIPEIEGISLYDLQTVQKRYTDVKASGDKTALEAMTGFPDTETDQPAGEQAETKPTEKPVEKPAPSPAVSPQTTAAVSQPVLPAVKPAEPKPEAKGEDVPDYLGRGLELLDKKQYAEAIVELDKAIEADPGNVTVKENLYEAHFQQGLVQFSKEEYLDSRKHFETAYRYNKECVNCPDYVKKCTETYMEKHYSMGIQYFGKEQLKEAIQEWKLVDAIDPGYKELGANLKKALLLNDRLEKIKKGQTP